MRLLISDEKTRAMLALAVIAVVSMFVFGENSLRIVEAVVTGVLTMTNVSTRQ